GLGAFEVDLRAGELRRNGLKVRLQDQPFQVLAMLLERPGETVTRDELRDRLWTAETFVDFDHGVNKAVNRIREALGDSATSPRFVETVARRGYRFIADVAVADAPPPVAAAVSAGDPTAPWAPREGAWGGPASSRWAIAGLALALASSATVWTLRARSPQPPPIRSLAVLPLENLSGDAAQEYFADGMTDELIATL